MEDDRHSNVHSNDRWTVINHTY